MTTDLAGTSSRAELASVYRSTLLDDDIPFWRKHGIDREHGGILTALDRDGSRLNADKSAWFQGLVDEQAGVSEDIDHARLAALEGRSCVRVVRILQRRQSPQ